jgi:SRSO17 transposase
MDAEAILGLRSALGAYLREFDVCMGRATNRRHLRTYVAGQLGPLERKSVEPIADAAAMPPRTLQAFLSTFDWDHGAVRDRHQRRVARLHHHDAAIGVIDATSFPKKGRKTAGVQRQHCGVLGKVENCVVSVHLGYATPTFNTLLDGEVYVPEESWCRDPDRRREAGIPDDLIFRTKPRIALDLLARARGNGISPAWLVFDEEYGGNVPFLHELDALGQRFVGEVPVSFRVWTKEPRMRSRRHPGDAQGRGRGGSRRPLMVQTNPMSQVEMVLAHSPLARKQTWVPYQVFESTKGPQVWEAIRLMVHLKKPDGAPTRPYHLVIAKSVLIKGEVKFFISNAPESTPVQDLLFVVFSRWRVERLFQESKGELGMDHFEARRFRAVQRHLILSCLSHAFLMEHCERYRGEKPGVDRLPGPRRREPAGAALERRETVLTPTG